MIIKLNLNGEYVGIFMDNTEKLPDGSPPIRGMCGICLNAEGTHYLFVSDYFSPNVVKVDLEGKNPNVFIYNCVLGDIPNGICLYFDRLSYYITMWGSNSIIKFDLDGTNITTFIDKNLLLQDGTQALIGPEAILQISPTKFLIANYDGSNIILYNSQMVCFGNNTKILTIGGYRDIQELRKGDLVKTLKNEFVPIYMISYKDIYIYIYISDISQERTKDKLYVCSKEKYPVLRHHKGSERLSILRNTFMECISGIKSRNKNINCRLSRSHYFDIRGVYISPKTKTNFFRMYVVRIFYDKI